MDYAEIVKYRNSNWGIITNSFTTDSMSTGLISSGVGDGVYVEILASGFTVGDWYDFDLQTYSHVDPGLEYPRRAVKAKHFWFVHFTSTERAKVWALCAGQTNVPTYNNSGSININLEQRYRLASFRDLTSSGSFFLDEQELCTVIDALETIDLLAPGRANEILERP